MWTVSQKSDRVGRGMWYKQRVRIVELPPLDVRPLLRDERARLLDLLAGLDAAQWTASTACPAWSVKDIALHLLDADLGWLSRERDHDQSGLLDVSGDFRSFVEALEAKHERWLLGARPLSTRVICELLELSGRLVSDFFDDTDLRAPRVVVWVGSEPVPAWFDLCRDLTERWVHHQQIRDAVGAPGLSEARWMAPILRTFVWSLPKTFRASAVAPGASVELRVLGPGGATWTVLHDRDEWHLEEGALDAPTAVVTCTADAAWRMFTGNAFDPRHVEVDGDPIAAAAVLNARGIIV